jgi:hypothetical protein
MAVALVMPRLVLVTMTDKVALLTVRPLTT